MTPGRRPKEGRCEGAWPGKKGCDHPLMGRGQWAWRGQWPGRGQCPGRCHRAWPGPRRYLGGLSPSVPWGPAGRWLPGVRVGRGGRGILERPRCLERPVDTGGRQGRRNSPVSPQCPQGPPVSPIPGCPTTPRGPKCPQIPAQPSAAAPRPRPVSVPITGDSRGHHIPVPVPVPTPSPLTADPFAPGMPSVPGFPCKQIPLSSVPQFPRIRPRSRLSQILRQGGGTKPPGRGDEATRVRGHKDLRGRRRGRASRGSRILRGAPGHPRVLALRWDPLHPAGEVTERVSGDIGTLLSPSGPALSPHLGAGGAGEAGGSCGADGTLGTRGA